MTERVWKMLAVVAAIAIALMAGAAVGGSAVYALTRAKGMLVVGRAQDVDPEMGIVIAAVEPADTDYLYFVSRNDGSHQFSRTLREHNKAVMVYQKGKHATATRGNGSAQSGESGEAASTPPPRP